MKIRPLTTFAAFFGVFLLAVGVSLNSWANLGNDSIAIFFDGVKTMLKLDANQLGTASTIVNAALIVLMWFLRRRYINIGTFINVIPYGFIVNMVSSLLLQWLPYERLEVRILSSIFGCLLLYIGVGIYVAADIGIDPFTGIVFLLSEKLRWPYRLTKILFDILLIAVGALMGGAMGVVTVFTAFTAGPCIQYVVQRVRPILYRDALKADLS